MWLCYLSPVGTNDSFLFMRWMWWSITFVADVSMLSHWYIFLPRHSFSPSLSHSLCLPLSFTLWFSFCRCRWSSMFHLLLTLTGLWMSTHLRYSWMGGTPLLYTTCVRKHSGCPYHHWFHHSSRIVQKNQDKFVMSSTTLRATDRTFSSICMCTSLNPRLRWEIVCFRSFIPSSLS